MIVLPARAAEDAGAEGSSAHAQRQIEARRSGPRARARLQVSVQTLPALVARVAGARGRAGAEHEARGQRVGCGAVPEADERQRLGVPHAA